MEFFVKIVTGFQPLNYIPKKFLDICLGSECASVHRLTLLSANSSKWSNTLKQFVGNSRQIVGVCLTILWGWRLKG